VFYRVLKKLKIIDARVSANGSGKSRKIYEFSWIGRIYPEKRFNSLKRIFRLAALIRNCIDRICLELENGKVKKTKIGKYGDELKSCS